jgi:hypothetical protein
MGGSTLRLCKYAVSPYTERHPQQYNSWFFSATTGTTVFAYDNFLFLLFLVNWNSLTQKSSTLCIYLFNHLYRYGSWYLS